MIGHYIKIALRALLADRFFSFTNIIGLSIGIAAVVTISVFVGRELSYDDWLKDPAGLYRIDTYEMTPGRDPVHIARSPGPVKAALLKDFPQIADITRGYLHEGTVLRDGQPARQTVLAADANFFALMGIPLVEGTPTRILDGTTSVAISEHRARELFGDTRAVGQRITLRLPEARDFVVTGVFEKIPETSHMAFDLVVPLEGFFRQADEQTRTIPDEWGGAYFHTYARLKDGANTADVEKGLDAFVDRNLPDSIARLLSTAPHDFFRFRFIPIRDVHFDGGPVAAMKPGGDRTSVIALSVVGFLILVVASVNFANLTSARSLMRGREVALRKVVGASRRDVVIQFLIEAAVISCIATLLSLALTLLSLPYVEGLLDASGELSLQGSWDTVPLLLMVIVLTTLASGLYPALVVSRIQPGTILNREANRASTGRIRVLLVTLQFAVSVGLIAVTIGMVAQMRYAGSRDLGFDRSNVLVVRIPEGDRQAELAESLKTASGRHPDILAAALSSAVPSDSSEHNISVSRPESPKPVQLGYHVVDSDFFPMLKVTPVAGRTAAMRQADSADTPGGAALLSGSAVINRAALRPLGLANPDEAIGLTLQSGDRSYTIVGVVPDLHFRSLHEAVRDEIYVLNDRPGGALSVRFKPGAAERAVGFVDRTWSARIADRPIDRVFLDQAIDALYVSEVRQAFLLSLFAAIAILLSCFGLVAMAAYTAQRRTKEIAIRKVFGARSRDILTLLLWQFTRPVIVASLLAWPVAWIVLRRWLDGFAYRIGIPYWAFAAAAAIAVAIALLAIATQTLRVSRLRPILALRHE